MTYAPLTLFSLMSYWSAQGGVNLGIVGDTGHLQKGTSYHLGRDDLLPGAYSARTARDLAGLTNAAAAVDLGRLDTKLEDLWAFSRWFAQRCFDRDPAYRDVREVIFWSVARQRVVGWSDLAPDRWINDYGDMTHKTHTHISFYRDSEYRDKRPMFRPYFTPPPEGTMPQAINSGTLAVSSDQVIDAKEGTPLYRAPGDMIQRVSRDATYDFVGNSGGFRCIVVKSQFDADTDTELGIALVDPEDVSTPRWKTAREKRETAARYAKPFIDYVYSED